MSFVYTVFLIDTEKCQDYLRGVKFLSESKVVIHVFFRNDWTQEQGRMQFTQTVVLLL